MLQRSAQAILNRVGERQLVLDVGGWAQPFERADWVLDVMPYATRGLYGYDTERADERFTAETWVTADICDRRPWPFADRQFDFAVCSHTLEDVRDPLWVCAELQRVARAGYIEVPSRREEQAWGVEGPWVGWTHHRWLIDVFTDAIEFTIKLHELHSRPDWYLPAESLQGLGTEARVQQLWWEQRFDARERLLFTAEESDAYLGGFGAAHGAAVTSSPATAPQVKRSSPVRRARDRIERALSLGRSSRRPR